MKSNYKIFFYVLGFLIALLIALNIYLLNINKKLQKKVDITQENYQYLEGYNEIIKYDLTTVRDSVRILEERIRNFEKGR